MIYYSESFYGIQRMTKSWLKLISKFENFLPVGRMSSIDCKLFRIKYCLENIGDKEKGVFD